MTSEGGYIIKAISITWFSPKTFHLCGIQSSSRATNWEHRLTASDVRQGEPDIAFPRFIDGERDCSPEDCGGIPGFYEMLEARADPTHPDHVEITERRDEYDPDELDVFPIQLALGRIAARRNAAAKCIMKPAND